MLKILYKIYFWAVVIPVFAIVTILAAMSVIIFCPLGGRKIFSVMPGVLWAKAACVLSLCRVKVIGRENITKGRSYVFAANHQSAYDIFLVYGYIGAPISWMMKKSLGKIPFVGAACRMLDFIFVDNTSARAAKKSIQDAEKTIKEQGRSLVVFPEGSRSPDGHIKPFKRGAFQIAAEQRLPIVPVTLNGPYYVMRTHSWDVRPHRMEMIIHPPIEPIDDEPDFKVLLQRLLEATQTSICSALWEEFR
ncbi:MAG: 1-acyl-sn-glycerol-3-phosphate acyltransferase [Tannerella sp.]|jgi:1-acyl-sn-glycerol-3-phosphate acyltransferase|nr:1-acyl-sn-glycerol-3-phosphate acyltransferase [Tannerella sp.]